MDFIRGLASGQLMYGRPEDQANRELVQEAFFDADGKCSFCGCRNNHVITNDNSELDSEGRPIVIALTCPKCDSYLCWVRQGYADVLMEFRRFRDRIPPTLDDDDLAGDDDEDDDEA